MDSREGDYMTISAAARKLGISRVTIYRMIHDGELHVWRDPVLKNPRALIPVEEIDALLAKRRA